MTLHIKDTEDTRNPKATKALSLRKIQSANELEQLSVLLNQSFSIPHGGQRFFDDFPIWDPQFSSYGQIERFGYFHDSQLISSALLRLAKLKTKSRGEKDIALIGGVATAKNHQGQGIATKTVLEAIRLAETRQAKMIILWGGEYSFYKKLGFEFFGKQCRIPLSELVKGSPLSEAGRLDIHRGFTPQIFQEIQKRQSGLKLDEMDFSWYQAHRNVQWFYTGTRDQPLAYAACGRGIDLKGIVHEWGGNIKELGKIFSYLSSQDPSLEIICSPEQCAVFGTEFMGSYEENLCLAKVLDPDFLEESIWIWGLDSA